MMINLFFIVLITPSSIATSIFTYDGVPAQNGTKVMALKSEIPDIPENFTVCASFYVASINGSVTYLEFWGEKKPWIHFWFYAKGSKNGLKLVMGFSMSYPESVGLYQLVPFEWYHVCIKINHPAGVINMALNGEHIGQDYFSEALKLSSEKGRKFNKIVLGDSINQYEKSIGMLNIYKVGLRSERMVEMSNSSFFARNGDILDWGKSVWAGQLKKETVKVKEIEREIFLDIDSRQTFQDATKTCKKFKGGSLYFPDVINDVQSIEKHFMNRRSECLSVWTNYSIENDANLPFAEDEPDGKSGDFCIYSFHPDMPTPIRDTQCDREMCFICNFPRRPLIVLRGMCDMNKKISIFYTPIVKNGTLYYIGITGAHWIEFDESRSEWKILSSKHGEVLAKTHAGKNSFGLGKLQWTIYNNSECNTCNSTPNYDVTLSLESCNKDQFNCDDGSCINATNRCDLKEDCEDKSDEKGCGSRVIMKSMYNKYVSPILNTMVTRVSLTILVTNINDINEESGYFWITGKFNTTWYDSRLAFKNLKMDHDLNALWDTDIDSIWMPWIALDNAISSSYIPGDVYVRVNVNKDFVSNPNELSSIQNEQIFSGRNNSITKRVDFNAKFLCSFLLTWKPFDFQHCFIDVVLAGDRDKYVELEAKVAEFRGSKYFQEYFIFEPTICKKIIGLKKGIRVEFLMKRRIPNILANVQTTFFPTILVNIIGQATFYMMPRYFNTAVTVNLTAMLLLTTMYALISRLYSSVFSFKVQ